MRFGPLLTALEAVLDDEQWLEAHRLLPGTLTLVLKAGNDKYEVTMPVEVKGPKESDTERVARLHKEEEASKARDAVDAYKQQDAGKKSERGEEIPQHGAIENE